MNTLFLSWALNQKSASKTKSEHTTNEEGRKELLESLFQRGLLHSTTSFGWLISFFFWLLLSTYLFIHFLKCHLTSPRNVLNYSHVFGNFKQLIQRKNKSELFFSHWRTQWLTKEANQTSLTRIVQSCKVLSQRPFKGWRHSTWKQQKNPSLPSLS